MKVFVTVPTTGWVHKRVAYTLLRLQLDQRYKLRIMLPTHVPFENNLHHCRKDFLRNGEDYWLSIDADNPPINNPLDLVELGLPLVGFPTPVWHNTGNGERPIYWNVYKKHGEAYKEWPDKKGLQRVDAVGTGCFIVSRPLMQHMKDGPFLRKHNPDGTGS